MSWTIPITTSCPTSNNNNSSNHNSPASVALYRAEVGTVSRISRRAVAVTTVDSWQPVPHRCSRFARGLSWRRQWS